MMPVASCTPFPFSASCDDMLTMLVCATRLLYMHLYTFAYMSMHESRMLVCHPYFNTMKLWTSNPNLHLTLIQETNLDTVIYLNISIIFLKKKKKKKNTTIKWRRKCHHPIHHGLHASHLAYKSCSFTCKLLYFAIQCKHYLLKHFLFM